MAFWIPGALAREASCGWIGPRSAAAVVEGVLAGLATMGGPHGALGAAPWTLQVTGSLLVFFVPGSAGFGWRVAGMLLVQLALWYVLLAALRRRRRR